MWALVETALWFPSSGGRRFSVHGCGSVHAVVELREDARDLHHLTGHYRTIRLVRALPGDRVADTLGRQLVKSSTSVAANYRAACRAQSTKDFVSKMKKVEEEADESVLWFALLRAGGVCVGANQTLDALGDEYDQLTRIAVQSIKTARLRLRRESIRYPVSRARRTPRDDS